MTDHDPVGNEQRAVDGDLDGGIYGPCLGPTTSASRWRQGESPVSADGRAEPVRLEIAPWVDTPCLTLDRSDSVRTVGPGVFHAIIPSTAHHGPAAQRERGGMRPAVGRRGPQPLGDAPLGKGQRSGDIQQSRARPAGQAQMNSLMSDRVASDRASRSVMRPFN